MCQWKHQRDLLTIIVYNYVKDLYDRNILKRSFNYSHIKFYSYHFISFYFILMLIIAICDTILNNFYSCLVRAKKIECCSIKKIQHKYTISFNAKRRHSSSILYTFSVSYWNSGKYFQFRFNRIWISENIFSNYKSLVLYVVVNVHAFQCVHAL